MTLVTSKGELARRLEEARAALERTIAPLSDTQLIATGPPDGWSVKDHLAHLTAWEAGIAAMLQQQPRYPAMGVDEETAYQSDEETLNAVIHERTRGRPLGEVWNGLRDTQRRLDDTLGALSDEDLQRTYSHYQPQEPGEDSGAPIIGWIAGNTYEHYEEHLPWIEALIAATAE